MTQIPQMNETQMRQALTVVQMQLAEARMQLTQARIEHEQCKLQNMEAAGSLRSAEEQLGLLDHEYRLAQDQVEQCRSASQRVRYFDQHVDQQRHLCDGELDCLRTQAARFETALSRQRSFAEQRRQAAVNVLQARTGKTTASSQFRRSQDAFARAFAREEFARQMMQAAGLEQ